MRYIVSLVLLFAVTYSYSQHTNFNTQRNWSLNKKEIMFGFGATQFLGDLGGRDRVGTDFSVVDIDWPSTGFGGMVAYRYRFHPYWATTFNLSGGLLRGDDALTNEVVREARNLNFRSIVIEYEQRIEAILYANEKFGARQRIRGLKHFKNRNEQIYLFTGVGVNYFEPKANYNGKWVKLRPLNTEGQGLDEHVVFPIDGSDNGAGTKVEKPHRPYKPFTLTIPFGIGMRMGIGKMWRMGIEATYVKTFSDYMDDVSTYYYDPAALIAANGGDPLVAELAERSTSNTTWFKPGQVRGDPTEKDAYFYLNLVFSRNLTYKSYPSYHRNVKWKGRYKF